MRKVYIILDTTTQYMPRKREHPLDFLGYPAYRILQALEHSHRTYTELYEVSTLSKSHFNALLNTLIDMGLIEETYIEVKRKRTKKFYKITQRGLEVLQRLRDVEMLCLAESTV